jgi:hypothetical protein
VFETIASLSPERESIHLKSLSAMAEPEKMSKSELKYIVWDFMTSNLQSKSFQVKNTWVLV